MAFTSIPGTSSSTPGNVEAGIGADIKPAISLASVDQFGPMVVSAAAAIRVTQVYVEFLASETSTGCVRLVGPMRIKTRLTGGVLV